MTLERLSASKETTVERHIFVKFGSSIINEKLGKIEDKFGIDYIHLHDGTKPAVANRVEHYNKNMKIKPCVIYKFSGDENKFEKLQKAYNNIDIISDKN